MAERGLSVDHTTIWRWTRAYGPEVYRQLRGNVKRKSSTWLVDETFVRTAGRWMYLFCAVDRSGQTVDFYLSETRDREGAEALRSYPAALRELQMAGHANRRCQQRTRRHAKNRIESNYRRVKCRLRAMQGPRTAATAWGAIQGIEAAQMCHRQCNGPRDSSASKATERIATLVSPGCARSRRIL